MRAKFDDGGTVPVTGGLWFLPSRLILLSERGVRGYGGTLPAIKCCLWFPSLKTRFIWRRLTRHKRCLWFRTSLKDYFIYRRRQAASFAASYHPSSVVLGFMPTRFMLLYGRGKSAGFLLFKVCAVTGDEERSHHGWLMRPLAL
ncbi:hypothetical protein HPP92_024111 [Vanilla planifolia]|uniref:Uncharacterized protein n=1 Tax=Vanilla planifolia TaxID=51239 RepID=A0A835UCM6_VANPL|nr:hypothetical protein HPP92_024430 [Vanilla planifolia]KAG0456323.1 hypothetical protein HPP92_024111 [Vanilla planifolia]